MSESAALETAENGTSGLPSAPPPATGDRLPAIPMSERESPLAASGVSTSPPSHNPPLVQISSPPEQDHSGNDFCGDISSASLSDDASIPGKDGSNALNDGKADSGGAELTEWTPPDETLQTKIIKQVEFYFSDANITKDAFLLKHVRRNKEGFVSLKLITSFKKVKSLTKDWRTVRHSLQSSTTLEVNEEGTKVKRKAPLPDYDETTPSRTVVAVNLPTENPSIEYIAELFGKCGEISLIRVLRPGKPFPSDVRKHIEKHTEVRNKVCALIEFESGQSALKAAKVMSDKDNWRTGMSVTVLAKEKKRDKKQSQEKSNNRKSAEGLRQSQGGDLTASDGGEGGDSAKKKRQRKKKNARVGELSGDGLEPPGTPSSSDTENSPVPSRRLASKPVGVPHSKSPAHLSPGNTPKGSPNPSPHGSPRQQRKVVGRSPLANSRSSPRNSPRASPEMGRKTNDSFSDHSNTSSPWVQRRKLLAATVPEGSPAGSPLLGRKNVPHSSEQESVLRSPHGPDGTRGFSAGRGRGRPISDVDELNTNLDPEVTEKLTLTEGAKADIILSEEEQLRTVAGLLEKLQTIKSTMDSEHTKGAPAFHDKLQPLITIQLDQKEHADRQSHDVKDLLESYNNIITLLSQQFVQWDAVMTRYEIAKKAREPKEYY